MSKWNGQDKRERVENQTDKINEPLDNVALSEDLAENVKLFELLFERDDTAFIRPVVNNQNPALQFYVAYCGGMVDIQIVNESVIKPLMNASGLAPSPGLADTVLKQVVFSHNPQKSASVKDIVRAVTYGETVVFLPGVAEALVLSTQGFASRGVTEPDGEKVLSGPKEGFTEVLITNLSMLHRKLRTNDLKMEFRQIGRHSSTNLCICYLDSVVNKKTLKELEKRLDRIDIDGVLDINQLGELIRDNPHSPFRTYGMTERPDVVVGKLLEGRFALIMDGTPIVMTAPYLFIENFQSSEDYYMNYYYTSFSRLLRMVGFLLTIFVPAVAVAVVAFHHEMLPTPLLVSISRERQSVPLPVVVEVVTMLIVFDILRETGIRMPSAGGQALSIVGALVVGQAAVAAKLVSSMVIIIVALTGITNLLVPKTPAAVIAFRFITLFFASCMGLTGVVMGLAVLIIHILNLESFGLPQVSAEGTWSVQRLKDSFIRAPMEYMRTRPASLTRNIRRLNILPPEDKA